MQVEGVEVEEKVEAGEEEVLDANRPLRRKGKALAELRATRLSPPVIAVSRLLVLIVSGWDATPIPRPFEGCVIHPSFDFEDGRARGRGSCTDGMLFLG